jgi:hypothetical protein
MLLARFLAILVVYVTISRLRLLSLFIIPIPFCLLFVGKKSNQSSPVTGLEWPRGFQEVKVPIFHDNGTGWW